MKHNKLFCIMLSLMLVLSFGTLFCFADGDPDTSSNITWSIDNGTLTIAGQGAMEDYESSSACPWYSRRSEITKIVIGDQITHIGDNAFGDCTGLTSITIPNSVTTIGKDILAGCSSLTSLTTPFVGTSKTSQDTLGCFFGASDYYQNTSKVPESLKTVKITGDITSVVRCAFFNCSNLTGIILPDSVKSIGSSAFQWCRGLTSFTIPDNVTTVADSAFSFSGLERIAIPDGVTSIGHSAFRDCISLQSIEIPDSVTSIGDSTFSNCTSLKSVKLPKNMTQIGNNFFSHCEKLTDITIPDGVTSIGYGAFASCSKLNNIIIPSSVTSIGADAFSYCSSLTSIAIPEGVTSLGLRAFQKCTGLTGVTLPDSLKTIGNSVFEGCSKLKNISIPANVTEIGDGAFLDCTSLTGHITFPDRLKYINKDVFRNCSGISGITIPDGVESILYNAFEGCTGITSVTFPDSVGTIASRAFYGVTGLKRVEIPMRGWIEPDSFNDSVVLVVYEDSMAYETVQYFNLRYDLYSGHQFDDGAVTTEPTYTRDGVFTYTCKTCGETKTEAIPKLTPPPGSDSSSAAGGDPNQKGRDGTAVGPGASAASADRAITNMTVDSDPAGTVFGKLALRSPKQTKNSIKLNWSRSDGEVKYFIYGNKCGKNIKPQKLAEVNSNTWNFKTLNGAKLQKGTYYKLIVVGLDKNNNVVSTSKVIHVATKGGKVGNHKKVTVSKSVIKKAKKLKKGKTLKLKVKAVPQAKKLKVKKHVPIRYESTDISVVTVSGKGVVKANNTGTCFVYAYAQNGAFKRIKVTVK